MRHDTSKSLCEGAMREREGENREHKTEILAKKSNFFEGCVNIFPIAFIQSDL